MCDARHRDSVKQVLVHVVEHAMLRLQAEHGRGFPPRSADAHGAQPVATTQPSATGSSPPVTRARCRLTSHRGAGSRA